MAGINEGDLLEGLSPHRFVGERHRAGAQTRGKAYAVRLQEALEDGDDALFEHLLNLDVETTSKGNRQRFITAMYLRCSDEMKAAIVAHPGVRMGEDVIGAELAFWVALLDQHSVEAVQALVARGVDPRRLRMLEGNAILQITSFMWGVEDEHVELLEYLIGLGGFDLDATNQSGRPAMVTAIARDKLAMARALHAAGCATSGPGWGAFGLEAYWLASRIYQEPHMAAVLHGELSFDLLHWVTR